jgi:hypothetical protein
MTNHICVVLVAQSVGEVRGPVYMYEVDVVAQVKVMLLVACCVQEYSAVDSELRPDIFGWNSCCYCTVVK